MNSNNKCFKCNENVDVIPLSSSSSIRFRFYFFIKFRRFHLKRFFLCHSSAAGIKKIVMILSNRVWVIFTRGASNCRRVCDTTKLSLLLKTRQSSNYFKVIDCECEAMSQPSEDLKWKSLGLSKDLSAHSTSFHDKIFMEILEMKINSWTHFVMVLVLVFFIVEQSSMNTKISLNSCQHFGKKSFKFTATPR